MLPLQRQEESISPRKNMVDCQIHTRGITHPKILDVFLKTPREPFVPSCFFQKAYGDGFIPLGGQRYMTPPWILAKMISCVELNPSHKILCIGLNTGYFPAILTKLFQSVYVWEKDDELITSSSQQLEPYHVTVLKVSDDFQPVLKTNDSYDIIFVDGAVHAIPQQWKDLLKEKGTLVAFESFILIPQTGRYLSHMKVITKNQKTLTTKIHEEVPQTLLFDPSSISKS